MTVRPLTTNEQADNGGYNLIIDITANDLTETATGTAQTLNAFGIKAGDVIGKVLWRAKTYFQDASDSAFNTTTMSVGDVATGVTKFISAIQLNVNGTEVKEGFTNTASAPYTATDTFTVTFNSQTGKSLSDIDLGEVVILVQLQRPSVLEQAVGGSMITK